MDKHIFANMTVLLLVSNRLHPVFVKVEDYWENVSGKKWTDSQGNPAVMKFAIRTGADNLLSVLDTDRSFYGKNNNLGNLFCDCEIIGVINELEKLDQWVSDLPRSEVINYIKEGKIEVIPLFEYLEKNNLIDKYIDGKVITDEKVLKNNDDCETFLTMVGHVKRTETEPNRQNCSN
jgi:hypothetical protein